MRIINTFLAFCQKRISLIKEILVTKVTLDDGGSGFSFDLSKLTVVGVEGANLVLFVEGIGKIRLPMTSRNFQFFIQQMGVYSSLATAALLGDGPAAPSSR